MNIKNKSFLVPYYILQGAHWMSVCVANGYAAFFLQSRGYSNTELGIIMALGNVGGFLLSPILASMIDRSGKVSVYNCLWGILSAQLMTLIIFAATPGRSLVLSILYALYLALVVAFNPMMTELCFDLALWSRPVSYSPARAIGSLCYALMALLMGQLSLDLGADILPYAGLCCLFIQSSGLLIISLAHRRLSSDELGSSLKSREKGLSLSEFILSNKGFCLLLFGTTLLYFSYSVADFYLINVLRNIGGDTGDMGKITCFKAMLEIPGMLFFARLTSRFRCSSVIRFASLMFVAKTVLFACAAHPSMLYVANLFQAVSFALMVPAVVKYVNLVIPAKDSAKGQAVASAMMTLGSILASLIGGRLYDIFTVHITLVIAVFICVAGSVVCFVASVNKP